jgi:hypothetical protein
MIWSCGTILTIVGMVVETDDSREMFLSSTIRIVNFPGISDPKRLIVERSVQVVCQVQYSFDEF